MHLAIFGPPRSGTTLLASLLNAPPGHPIIDEPRGLAGEGLPDDYALSQFERLGVPPMPWPQLVAHLESNTTAWGVKLVQGGDLRALIALPRLAPRRILAIVRDIRHCAVSYRERLAQANRLDRLERRMDWMAVAAQTVLWLRGLAESNPEWRDRLLIVRYEDLVHSSATRQHIGAWTGFPTGGELDYFLRGDPRTGGREGEADRHGGRISAAPIAEALRRLARPENAALAEEMHERCADFQQAFGYADADR